MSSLFIRCYANAHKSTRIANRTNLLHQLHLNPFCIMYTGWGAKLSGQRCRLPCSWPGFDSRGWASLLATVSEGTFTVHWIWLRKVTDMVAQTSGDHYLRWDRIHWILTEWVIWPGDSGKKRTNFQKRVFMEKLMEEIGTGPNRVDCELLFEKGFRIDSR